MSAYKDAVMASLIAKSVPQSEEEKVEGEALRAHIGTMQKANIGEELRLLNEVHSAIIALPADAPASVRNAYDRLLDKVTA